MMRVDSFWPDVPAATFTILRQIAQARQEQADIEARAGPLPISDGTLGMVASLLCEPHADRASLVHAAALIVRCIEARNAKG